MTRMDRALRRLRYAFDSSMAAGPIALIGWLTVVTLVLTTVAGAVLALSGIRPQGAERLGFVEAAWQALMRTMDPGVMGADVGWPFRLVALGVTALGLVLFSTLVGIVSNAIGAKLDQLRKGRSFVLEKDHTLILNWSASVFDVINELCLAKASERKPRIVVLADKDKVEMEDAIAAKVRDPGRTRIIFRSGDPTDPFDLALVNPEACKSIIVLSPEGPGDPDPCVIKTVLALVHDSRRRPAPYRIAAELRARRNVEVLKNVGGDEVHIVLADDLISRIVLHSSHQVGLSAVYTELLDFHGCEIYTWRAAELAGQTFGEALNAFEGSTLIGLCDGGGRIKLNPPMTTVIAEDAEVILIAEDDHAIRPAPPAEDAIDDAAILQGSARRRDSEQVLILGWNRRGCLIVREMARYLQPGSRLTVAADVPGLNADVARAKPRGGDLKVECLTLDPSDADVLDDLDPAAYDSVIVLGYSDHMDPQQADTRTLITLLHLRKIAERAGVHINVVSEIADVRNRELAEITRADDFVVSNRLISLMLAQVSENQHLSAIFADLLNEDGSAFRMRPVGDYVDIARPASFATLVEAARRRGETAVGYRRVREAYDDPDDIRKLHGVVVNPKKAETVLFQPEDRIIVLAED